MPAIKYTTNVDGRIVRLPSVTTVLKYVGDKGGLMGWYFKQGKEAMRLEIEEDHAPYNTVWDLPKTAAEIGTVAHAMIEADIHGKKFNAQQYPPDIIGPAGAAFDVFLRWKKKRSFDPIATEVSLVSNDHRYGGTLDFASMDSERTLVDWKTGKGPYAEHVMQLAAYLGLWRENREEPIDSVAIVRLNKEDGSVHLHDWPVESPTIKAAWEGFLAARKLYDVLTKNLKDVS